MADQTSSPAIDYDRIDTIVTRVVESMAPKPSTPDDPIALRAEYQIVVDVIKLLSDIRFRCLVFVTAIVGVANAWLATTGDAGTRFVLGALGLVATLGITVYDLRNSQLYEAAMHRAKTIEYRLRLQRSSSPGENAGLFGERPPYVDRRRPNAPMRFWLIPVKHDVGLGLIYGGALGAWVYLLAYGLLSRPTLSSAWRVVVGYPRLAAALLGGAAGAWSIVQYVIHDKFRVKQPQPPPATETMSASEQPAI